MTGVRIDDAEGNHACVLGALIAVAMLSLAAGNGEARNRDAERRDLVTTQLKDASGASRGTAALYQRGQVVRVEVIFTGAEPGSVHAVHLHLVGRCHAPDLASAGEHWNPGRVGHGLENPWGGHAGDLPNLQIGPDGTGRIDAQIDAIALTEGQPPLVNLGAIVVHADRDDMMSDPAGNSGARIACGAFGSDASTTPPSH